MSEQITIAYKFHGLEQSKLVIAKRPENFDSKEFNFSLNIHEKINPEKGIVISVVQITFSSLNNEPLAEIELLIGFEIEDFDKVVSRNKDGLFVLPKEFKDDIHQECISTSRGYVLFLLKGSYLHKAIIPLIKVSDGKHIKDDTLNA